jgi:hypothetical protein
MRCRGFYPPPLKTILSKACEGKLQYFPLFERHASSLQTVIELIGIFFCKPLTIESTCRLCFCKPIKTARGAIMKTLLLSSAFLATAALVNPGTPSVRALSNINQETNSRYTYVVDTIYSCSVPSVNNVERSISSFLETSTKLPWIPLC